MYLKHMVAAKIEDPKGKTRTGFEGTLQIDRQEVGISYSKAMDHGGWIVGDAVNIELVGEAVLQTG